MPIRATVKPLVWESEFFALTSGLITFDDEAPELSDDTCAAWPRLQAKVASRETTRIDALQKSGFKLVEGEADFTWPLEETLSPGIPLRCAVPADIVPLRAMAGRVFSVSRFRAPWYAPGDAARFYAEWVGNAVSGTFDDVCLVAEDAGEITGFVTLRQLADDVARIGLLAGRGEGARLINAARRWCQEHHIKTLHVTTQLSNLAAMRCYLLSGARLTGTAYWLYR